MNILVVQSGGPTAVWNATLYGILQAAGQAGLRVYGALGGLKGALDGQVHNLSAWPAEQVNALPFTPGGVLGSSRYQVRPGDMERLLALCDTHAIGGFLYMGGNGSMLTPLALDRLVQNSGRTGPRIIGVPKTVDNDLHGTDHSPGFPSAARFIAQATQDGLADLTTMAGFDTVKILEVMGRNAGWLTAAAALANVPAGAAPPLILVPEAPFVADRFLAAVQDTYRRYGHVYVAASEGVREADGTLLAAKAGQLVTDALGRPVYGAGRGVGDYLSTLVRQRLSLPARFDKPGTVTRGSGALVASDTAHAIRLGAAAAEQVRAGASGVMVGLRRLPDSPGDMEIITTPLSEVAGRERCLPAAWIGPDGELDRAAMTDYAAPLIGPLPVYAALPGRELK